jgi:hypothetical protein
LRLRAKRLLPPGDLKSALRRRTGARRDGLRS